MSYTNNKLEKQQVLEDLMGSVAEKEVKNRLDEFAKETPTSDLLPKTKTAVKAKEEKSETTATQQKQSEPSESDDRGLLSKLMISVGSGMAAAGGMDVGVELIGDLLKSQEKSKTKLTPEAQVATLQQTQALLKEAGINATVGVTATGAPTVSVAASGGIEGLPAEQQVAARDLARRLYGVRGADKGLPGIVKSLQEGKTIDQIEDDLRYAQQSSKFNDGIRGAAQQITVGKSSNVKQRTFDELDDLVSKGDTEGTKSFLKRMAVKNAVSITEAQNVNGMETTITLLDQIQDDLDNLERMGIPTGFWSGSIENMLAKVGQVKDPEKRKVATKIAVNVMQYRRAMTGVQFGMKEHTEYKRIFPDIDKVGELNRANIDALTETFQESLDKFYSLAMGEDNYNNIFRSGMPTSLNMNDWEEITDE